jgi:hypothetical protein
VSPLLPRPTASYLLGHPLGLLGLWYSRLDRLVVQQGRDEISTSQRQFSPVLLRACPDLSSKPRWLLVLPSFLSFIPCFILACAYADTVLAIALAVFSTEHGVYGVHRR